MKRAALLDAAEAVLFEDGTQCLTLAAVAERAGVSKGGLLYHFPNKEALIQALVSRVVDDFDAQVASYDAPSYTHAFIEATFAILTDESEATTRRRWATVTAAAASPELIAPMREALKRWHHRDPAENTDPVAAMIARLAAEGLWEVAAHDPAQFSAEQYASLRRRLLDLL